MAQRSNSNTCQEEGRGFDPPLPLHRSQRELISGHPQGPHSSHNAQRAYQLVSPRGSLSACHARSRALPPAVPQCAAGGSKTSRPMIGVRKICAARHPPSTRMGRWSDSAAFCSSKEWQRPLSDNDRHTSRLNSIRPKLVASRPRPGYKDFLRDSSWAGAHLRRRRAGRYALTTTGRPPPDLRRPRSPQPLWLRRSCRWTTSELPARRSRAD